MRIIPVLTLAALLAGQAPAHAFCGFYVGGAGAKLFNNATQVVLMRAGTRTVLSMQNNYQGPPADFAMVVPVPVVLQKKNVKTLSPTIFDRVDRLAAPRLVEYWEIDPCWHPKPKNYVVQKSSAGPRPTNPSPTGKHGVTIEAQFEVGEYDIVILSAKDSTGLDTWLRENKYKIPEGAEPLLRPYVKSGSKFFVAKVNVKKVEFNGNQAMLSPLRFHYDSTELKLPVRLGLMNAKDKQDLIVHILAPQQRYQVANYKNITIPTNLDVTEEARSRFGEFYAALFDRTLEKNPGAVITEYSWDASSCDPCPSPALNPTELATLGADVLFQPSDPQTKAPASTEQAAKKRAPPVAPPEPPAPPRLSARSFVLTRLHARYSASSLKDDLVFEAAPAIAGGRERPHNGQLEQGSTSSRVNNFQARYAVRHRWNKAIKCKDPIRGRWGGPWPEVKRDQKPTPAVKLAFAPRGKLALASVVRQDLPELGVRSSAKPIAEPSDTGAKSTKKKGCGCRGSGSSGGALLLLAALLLGLARSARSWR